MSHQNQLTDAEEKLAEIIWKKAPLSSPELVLLAEETLGWKKSTTYTILKKLCNKGVFQNQNATITILLTKEAQMARQSRGYVEEAFDGSLPRFITAFFSGKALSPKQASALKQFIESYEEGSSHDD